jgi:hypothetical protein
VPKGHWHAPGIAEEVGEEEEKRYAEYQGEMALHGGAKESVAGEAGVEETAEEGKAAKKEKTGRAGRVVVLGCRVGEGGRG